MIMTRMNILLEQAGSTTLLNPGFTSSCSWPSLLLFDKSLGVVDQVEGIRRLPRLAGYASLYHPYEALLRCNLRIV